MAYKTMIVQAFDKKVPDETGQLAATLAPIAAAKINLLCIWGWTEGKEATVRICLSKPTPKQLSVIEGAGFTPAKGSAIGIACPNQAGVVQAMAEALGNAGLSLDAFTGMAVGTEGLAVAFFDDQMAAEKAAKALKGTQPGMSAPKKASATKKATAKEAAPKKAPAEKKATTKAAAPKKAPAEKKATTKAAAPKKAPAEKKATTKAAAPKKASAEKKTTKKA